ncbi:hypothetical protein PFLUOLIPICF7_25710 [Pseudomonas simiae]|nr:hypothetical protein PFLUOLIPICF7_25710 [Pseudomonas simiae]
MAQGLARSEVVAQSTQQRDEFGPGKCHVLIEQFGEQLVLGKAFPARN